jgi:hypothetical protein
MKLTEKSVEANINFLVMFHVFSISYPSNVNAIFDSSIFWLWPAKFSLKALEGPVASEINTPGLSRTP